MGGVGCSFLREQTQKPSPYLQCELGGATDGFNDTCYQSFPTLVINIGAFSPTVCYDLELKMDFHLMFLGEGTQKPRHGAGVQTELNGICVVHVIPYFQKFAGDQLCLREDKNIFPTLSSQDRIFLRYPSPSPHPHSPMTPGREVEVWGPDVPGLALYIPGEFEQPSELSAGRPCDCLFSGDDLSPNLLCSHTQCWS